VTAGRQGAVFCPAGFSLSNRQRTTRLNLMSKSRNRTGRWGIRQELRCAGGRCLGAYSAPTVVGDCRIREAVWS
jgi:hypothetical protein